MKRKNVLLFFAAFFTLNNYAQPFSIMTYNIRCGYCDENNLNNWNSRKELLLSIIKKNNADLIGFQEVVQNQLEYLKTNLADYNYFGSGREADGSGEGCYIFYKKLAFTIDSVHSGTKWYSSTPDIAGSNDMGDKYNRIITYARFKNKITNKYFYHFNTHLTYIDSIQIKYINFLTKIISNRAIDDPFILSGDFNASEISPAIKELKGNLGTTGLIDSYREINPKGNITTFNNFTQQADGIKIDYIFIQGNKFKTISASCDSTVIDGKNPSDHNAICAKITFK